MTTRHALTLGDAVADHLQAIRRRAGADLLVTLAKRAPGAGGIHAYHVARECATAAEYYVGHTEEGLRAVADALDIDAPEALDVALPASLTDTEREIIHTTLGF